MERCELAPLLTSVRLIFAAGAPQLRLLSLTFIAAVAAGACDRTPNAHQTMRPCSDGNMADRFFPPDAFVPTLVEVDDDLRDTLAHYLQAAKETPWICGQVPTEGYRLFIGGGYGLPAIVASAARASSGWLVAFSRFESRRSGPAYQVAAYSSNQMQDFPSDDIRQALQRAAFWSGPTWQQIEGEGDIVMIEVVDGPDHRAVVQAVPTPEFRNAAALIMRSATGSDDVLQQRDRGR